MVQTITTKLNALGYYPKKVAKSQPPKISATAAIFDHVIQPIWPPMRRTMSAVEAKIQRLPLLGKWFVDIVPTPRPLWDP